MNQPMREAIKGILEEIYAVELLEYHDKNLLSGDNKSRSEWRQERLKSCMWMLERPSVTIA